MKRNTLKKLAKRFTALAAVTVLAAASLAGCGQKEDKTVIKVGYGTVLCQAPLQIAIEKGYFEEEGLEFEPVRLDGIIMEYVGSGQVDAGYGLASKFIQPIENGLPITLTAGIHTGCIKVLTKEDSGIETIADLKGKTIGCAGIAEAPCVLLKRALHAAGVGITADNMEVDFVVYTNAELSLALENGSVDAIALVDPAATVGINQYGFKTLLDQATDPVYGKEYCCVTFVTNDFIEKHPDIAAKFTRAVMKASQWVEDNPYEAAAYVIEHEYVTGDPEVCGAILDSYNFTPSVQGGYDALASNVREFAQIGLLDPNTDTEAFIAKSFKFLDGVEETYGSAKVDDCCEGHETAAAESEKDCCKEHDAKSEEVAAIEAAISEAGGSCCD